MVTGIGNVPTILAIVVMIGPELLAGLRDDALRLLGVAGVKK